MNFAENVYSWRIRALILRMYQYWGYEKEIVTVRVSYTLNNVNNKVIIGYELWISELLYPIWLIKKKLNLLGAVQIIFVLEIIKLPEEEETLSSTHWANTNVLMSVVGNVVNFCRPHLSIDIFDPPQTHGNLNINKINTPFNLRSKINYKSFKHNFFDYLLHHLDWDYFLPCFVFSLWLIL